MITIGIDPGLSGAIALLDHTGSLIDVYDMPRIDKRVNPVALADLEDWTNDQFGTVVLEDVHAVPVWGKAACFSFGRSKGVIEGVFAGAHRPIIYVSPSKWKKDLALDKDKGQARQRAVNLWPSKAKLFARVMDDGRAEAALLAHWYQTRRFG